MPSAIAQPFVTHSNAFGTDLYLRIASEPFSSVVWSAASNRSSRSPELRNEGADSSHSLEFATLYGALSTAIAEEVRQLPGRDLAADPGPPRHARPHRKCDLPARRFELAAYSELVESVVQRERLVARARRAAKGEDEAMPLDEDYLRAMEYGNAAAGRDGNGNRAAR